MANLIDSIKGNEGFRQYPYIDPLVANNPVKYGIPVADFQVIKKHFNKLKTTFGYGFTFLTEEEAAAVLKIRIEKVKQDLANTVESFAKFDPTIQDMLTEMSYQIGVNGVSHFHRTLAALRNRDWCEAYKEGKDSKWYVETTARAERVLSPLKGRCANKNKKQAIASNVEVTEA